MNTEKSKIDPNWAGVKVTIQGKEIITTPVVFCRKGHILKTDNEITAVIIKCPSCASIQGAIVEWTSPWATFIHQCIICEYTIMESEWDEVQPFKSEKI